LRACSRTWAKIRCQDRRHDRDTRQDEALVFQDDQKLITDTLDQLTDGVHTLLNMTWFAKGAVKAKAPTGDVSFKNAFIRFSPRYLVENFSGDKSIEDDMNVKNAQEYAAKVAEIEAAHGIDCRIKIVKTGVSKWEVKPDAPGPGKKAPQGGSSSAPAKAWRSRSHRSSGTCLGFQAPSRCFMPAHASSLVLFEGVDHVAICLAGPGLGNAVFVSRQAARIR
jgi:hypothetical protein